MTIAQSIDKKDKLCQADHEFSARIGFLGAAMGQPHLVTPQDIDHKLIERYVARGQVLRASAMRDGITQAVVWIKISFVSLLRNLKNWSRQRRDMKALNALNDHMLKDIGLTRGDVESLSNGSVSVSELNAQRTLIAKRGKRSCKVYKFDSVRPPEKIESNREADSPDYDIAA